MNTEIIKDEIKWLLEAINEQFEAIHSHGNKIPQIEFDILMDNVRKFYQDMHMLQRMNDPLPSSERKITNRDAVQAAVNSSTETRGGKIIHRTETGQPVNVQPDKSVKVKFSDPEPVAPEQKVPDEGHQAPVSPGPLPFKPSGSDSVRQEFPAGAKKTSKTQEIDLFASEEPEFSIKLKEAREKTFGPKIPSGHIENLKTAITINEKFMFINELFDGNLREYNETIETLNGFKTLDQAADFLDLMRKKDFWNTGSNAFKKLKELVERRF